MISLLHSIWRNSRDPLFYDRIWNDVIRNSSHSDSLNAEFLSLWDGPEFKTLTGISGRKSIKS